MEVIFQWFKHNISVFQAELMAVDGFGLQMCYTVPHCL